MAKLPSQISNRQVIQLLRTSGSSEHVSAVLSESAASGEIAIQLPEQASATSLWTLAKDGKKAVQFVNKEQVEKLKENVLSSDTKIKASETVGPHSVTYINKTSYQEKKILSNEELEYQCYQICLKHLALTGLMYRGF